MSQWIICLLHPCEQASGQFLRDASMLAAVDDVGGLPRVGLEVVQLQMRVKGTIRSRRGWGCRMGPCRSC